jgi:hypothetical protein
MRKKRKPRYVLPPGALCYSPRQFASAAGISVSLLYDLWKKNKGPPFKMLNTRRVIEAEEGRAWLQGE